MTLLETDYLRDRLETIELDELNHPERLDTIIYSEGEEKGYGDMQEWISDAEKWNISPRRAVFIPNYWELDDEIERELTEAMREEMKSPALEGSRLATNAVQAQREKAVTGFSSVIGFEVPDLNQSIQRNQIGAPQGDTSPVDVPEWYPSDDWYSEVEDDRVGIIVDDHTVYARHIMDNILQEETEEQSFDFRFWQGYQDTLQNYTGML